MTKAYNQPWYQKKIIIIPIAFVAAGMIRGIIGYTDDNTGYNNQPLKESQTAGTPKATKAEMSLHTGMTKSEVTKVLGNPTDHQGDYWAYPSVSIRFDTEDKVVAGNFGGLLKEKVTRSSSIKQAQIKTSAKVFGQLSVQHIRALREIYRSKKVNDNQTMYAFKTPEGDALVRLDDSGHQTQVFLWNDAKQEIGQKVYYAGETKQ
ncbi:hypothetical protein [Lacticaseibacillus camelliae]|nr:hypothetical protein [Lacticaseibacillus camelliae]